MVFDRSFLLLLFDAMLNVVDFFNSNVGNVVREFYGKNSVLDTIIDFILDSSISNISISSLFLGGLVGIFVIHLVYFILPLK